jgi:hypothetical protein
MDTEHAPEHQWPDDEPVRDERPEPPRSRRERIVRALGDVFLTAGMGRAVGLFGGVGGDTADVRAATNVILFGEGESKGRDANRGSGSERR